MASETPAATARPPLAFQADTVSLRVERLPGHGLPRQMLVLKGKGGSTLQSGRQPGERAVNLAPADVIALLNGLHQLRFFDLPALLGPVPTLLLMPDGRVLSQVAAAVDVTTTKVCVSLPGYDKCVQYTEGQGPRELQAWVDAAMTDALRRAPETGAGK